MTDRHAIFRQGDFRLHSGLMTRWLIDCDRLTDEDLDTLAFMLAQRLQGFGSVEGVPRGGLRLAQAMRLYCTAGPLLIVDDVYTTGTSLIEHRGEREAIGAVLFARSRITEDWVTALFTMAPTWVEIQVAKRLKR